MKKTIFPIFLVFLFIFPIIASASTSSNYSYSSMENSLPKFDIENYSYNLLDDGTIEITDYIGNNNILTIPSELDGYVVSAIASEAFSTCYWLASIDIPNSVTSIGDKAFYMCKGLKSISIPDSVTSFGNLVFAECNSLEHIQVSPDHPLLATIENVLFHKVDKKLILYPAGIECDSYSIPHGIQHIEAEAFSNCKNLKSILIPNSVTLIGDRAFAFCSNLTSISIPDSVISIGKSIFYSCEALEIAYISNSLMVIEDNPFIGCISLRRLEVSRDHSSLEIIDGALFDKTEKKLICFPAKLQINEYIVPNGTKVIGEFSFYNCGTLTSVIIPDSVTSIGTGSFLGCIALNEVSLPASITYIGDNAFLFSSPCFTVIRNSYANQWAKDQNQEYIYPDSYDWLVE